MLGLWIDNLTDEQKDRIVEGQGWEAGAFMQQHGNKCLLGHVADVQECHVTGWMLNGVPILDVFKSLEIDSLTTSAEAFRFDRLFLRYGDRLVRALKTRAASTMSSHIERAIEREEPVTCTV